MCIGFNWVNHAQDLMYVTKFEDFPNSLIPNTHVVLNTPKFHYSPYFVPTVTVPTVQTDNNEQDCPAVRAHNCCTAKRLFILLLPVESVNSRRHTCR